MSDILVILPSKVRLFEVISDPLPPEIGHLLWTLPKAVRINSWLFSACLAGESVYDKIVTHQENWKSNRIPTYFTCIMILYNAYCSIVQVNCFLVSLCLCCMRWISVRRIKSIQNLNFRFGISKNTSDYDRA